MQLPLIRSAKDLSDLVEELGFLPFFLFLFLMFIATINIITRIIPPIAKGATKIHIRNINITTPYVVP